jgi:hypothetical protein
MPLASRLLASLVVLVSTAAPLWAFQYLTLYTFKAQPRLAELGRADTGWYFAGSKTSGIYPRTTTMMREGGFSDLVLDPTDATGHTFLTVQDRGLAVSFENNNTGDTAFKIFAYPGHRQKVMRVRVQGDSVETLTRDSIGGLDTGFVTGLPSSRVTTDEVAVRMRFDSAVVSTATMRRVTASPNGYDFEGLARAADGTLYLADEMGPRIVRVDATTKRITREWRPSAGLPRVFARRRDNRGLESLCLTPSGKLAGLMQGGLYNTASGKRSNAKDSTRVLRFFILDPANDAVREHVYLMDLKGGTRVPGDVKIGAMACLSDSSFVALEHGEDGSGHDWIDLYRLDIVPLTSDVHDANDATGNGRLYQGGLKTLEQLGYIPGDSTNLVAAGITPLRKRLLVGDLMERTAWPHDTPEGLAFVNDSTIAILNDNNYAQEDNNGDGIPHLVGQTKRLTQVMYLNVGPGLATAIRTEAPRLRAASRFTVKIMGTGWTVQGPLGTTARLTDVTGRLVFATETSTGGALHVATPQHPGVYVLVLRAGNHTEIFRVTRP